MSARLHIVIGDPLNFSPPRFGIEQRLTHPSALAEAQHWSAGAGGQDGLAVRREVACRACSACSIACEGVKP